MDIQKFFTPATTLLKSNNEIINLFLISFTALLFLPINYFTSNNPVEVFKRFVVRQLSSPLVIFNLSLGIMLILAFFLLQIEQLHCLTTFKSDSISKAIEPQ